MVSALIDTSMITRHTIAEKGLADQINLKLLCLREVHGKRRVVATHHLSVMFYEHLH